MFPKFGLDKLVIGDYLGMIHLLASYTVFQLLAIYCV